MIAMTKQLMLRRKFGIVNSNCGWESRIDPGDAGRSGYHCRSENTREASHFIGPAPIPAICIEKMTWEAELHDSENVNLI